MVTFLLLLVLASLNMSKWINVMEENMNRIQQVEIARKMLIPNDTALAASGGQHRHGRSLFQPEPGETAQRRRQVANVIAGLLATLKMSDNFETPKPIFEQTSTATRTREDKIKGAFETDPVLTAERRRKFMAIFGITLKEKKSPSRNTIVITQNKKTKTLTRGLPSPILSKEYVEGAIRRKSAKYLSMGSVAAGALGLLVPGPVGSMLSALLAPAVIDLFAEAKRMRTDDADDRSYN